MTRRQMLVKINSEIQKAKASKNYLAVQYWQTIKWMANRPSMKTWTLEQLEQQYAKTNNAHNIKTETLVTGINK